MLERPVQLVGFRSMVDQVKIQVTEAIQSLVCKSNSTCVLSDISPRRKYYFSVQLCSLNSNFYSGPPNSQLHKSCKTNMTMNGMLHWHGKLRAFSHKSFVPACMPYNKMQSRVAENRVGYLSIYSKVWASQTVFTMLIHKNIHQMHWDVIIKVQNKFSEHF